MKALLTGVRRQAATLALIVISVVLVVWIVQTKRPPGAMTIVEAQAMDMTAMKPPPGAFPVAVQEASLRPVAGAASYPGEVFAYSDEDVTARVAGRVKRILVYPGDRVHAGQLLAELDADELAASALESRMRALAQGSLALAASRDVEAKLNALTRARSQLKGSRSAHERAQLEHRTAVIEWERAQSEVAMAKAEVASTQANLAYAEQELLRAQNLHKQGAISLDELQRATRERDSERGKLEAANAAVRAAELSQSAAERKIDVMRAAAAQAGAEVVTADAMVKEAEADLKRAREMFAAERNSTAAERAAAGASGAIAEYRHLRALADGSVAERLVSPGTAVEAGQTVLRLKVDDRVRVQAELPQALAAGVRVGDPLQIESGSVNMTAAITSVFPTVSPDSRTFRIESIVPNRERALKPGMYVRIRLSGSRHSVVAVPAAAIRREADAGAYVWVLAERRDGEKTTDWTCTMHPEVSEPGPGVCPKCKMDLVPREGTSGFTAERRAVKVGASDGRLTAVLEGIRAGEKVIWAGHADLYPGAPVAPTEWGESGPKTLPPAPGTGPSGHEGHGAASRDSAQPSPASESNKTSIARDGFSCLMHPEVSSKRPGTCPKCKMDLVKRSEIS